MRWCEGRENAWKEIIETVAREYGRSVQMVEKDTLQSMLLYQIAMINLPLVFKGVTSLSKAYGVVKRFSEDIDLSAARKLTEGEKTRTKKELLRIAEELGLRLKNPEEIQSRYSYNRYVFTYTSLFGEESLEILVETNFYLPVYPTAKQSIKSFVGEFCEERDIKLPVAFPEMHLAMEVQSIERTFVDKVFAVCDYYLENMQSRDSRHLYDIAKMVPLVNPDAKMKELIAAVRKDRQGSKNNPSAQLEHDITAMLREIMEQKFFQTDYVNVTQKLLYEDISYEEAIAKGIDIVAKWNVF